LKSPSKKRPLRNPGQSQEKRLEHIFFDDVLFPVMGSLVFLLLAAMEWWRWYSPGAPSPVTMTVFALMFLSFSVWKLCRIVPQARQIRLGLDGERVVGDFLEQLCASGAAVIHDFPADGFNLKHLVVHPSGVYYIETHTIAKPAVTDIKLYYDGETVSRRGKALRGSPVIQARSGADWLTKFIRQNTGLVITVQAVVTFPGCCVESSAEASSSDVRVLQPKALPRFIANQSTILDADSQGACERVLRDHVREAEL